MGEQQVRGEAGDQLEAPAVVRRAVIQKSDID